MDFHLSSILSLVFGLDKLEKKNMIGRGYKYLSEPIMNIQTIISIFLFLLYHNTSMKTILGFPYPIVELSS